MNPSSLTLSITLLLVCAAALSLVSAAAGGFFTLWAMHVQRTGVHPLPALPKITLFRRRKPASDPDDDDEDDEPNDTQKSTTGRVGP